MSRKNVIILVSTLIMIAGVIIIFSSVAPKASALELKLANLVDDQKKYADESITVEGLLVEDSIQWDADNIELKFTVTNEDGDELHVTHKGIKPDNFTEGVITILQGKPTGKDNQFIADKVQTRCPSKYEGQDSANYDVEKHKDRNKELIKE